MNKVICIYHSRDLDGWMSAAIVKNRFLGNRENPSIDDGSVRILEDISDTIEFLGWDYGDEIPNLSEYDKIIMCDISFPADEMFNLYNRLTNTGRFIWIDHHISAIKAIDNVGIRGLRDTNFAACELTWKYFFPNEKMPEIVRLLGRYDCFQHKGTEEEQTVLEFQYAARESISDYEEAYDSLCADMDHDITGYMISDGKVIYNYLCTEAEQIYNRAFPMRFEVTKTIPNTHVSKFKTFSTQTDVYNFLVVNQERFNPINFSIDYHKDGCDGFACFWYNNGNWNFSLYNDDGKVDCSLIAKQYGGGGHKGASGFVIKDLTKIIE